MQEGPTRQECGARLWGILTGDSKAAAKSTSPASPEGEGWLVSETTSPVDYSPQVNAATLSHATAENAPSTLTVRCRLQRIELSVSTVAGSWKASGNGQFRVAYRVGLQPAVEEQWVAAQDGRTASFKGDTQQLLQSLPDSGPIAIGVFDWQGPAHEAVFQLDGIAAVRQKILAACKAPTSAERAPARRRR
jgi:hypothetical protein